MKERFFLWYESNRRLFWGMLIGLITAVLFLTIGFWRTLLIGVCIGAGAFISTHEEILNVIYDFFNNLFRNNNENG